MKHVLLTRGSPVLAAAVFAIAGVVGAQTYSAPSGGDSANSPAPAPTDKIASPPAATPDKIATPPAATPDKMASPPAASTDKMAMPSAAQKVPARNEPADAAFRALDASNRGYLQKSDVNAINGFSFEQADTNKDGKLTKDEFAKAWSASK